MDNSQQFVAVKYLYIDQFVLELIPKQYRSDGLDWTGRIKNRIIPFI